MGYLIEIETKEMQHASEYAEKALKYMGKVMQCISSWEDEAGMGERGGMNYREEDEEYGRSMMGSRRGYGMRGGMGYRDEDYDDEMSERRNGRRRRSNGRYY
ncbi:MAG: hypothetical protein II304_04015 [Bacteroidales bacterium]|nr:hypothetical protein [Bacteroidales bacterium]